MNLTLSGIIKVAKFSQQANAPSHIIFTLFGIVTEVRLVQPRKALGPIVSTPSSIFIDCSPVHRANASVSIQCTLPGIVTEVKFVH